MSKPLQAHSAVTSLIEIPGAGTVLAAGTTVPSSTSQGYAPGCIFVDFDAATEATRVYINQGTRASSTFTAFDFNFTEMATSVSGLLATSAEINRAAQVSTRVVNATASTLTVTEALHDGKTIVLDRAAGIAVTLPAAAAGLKFRFIVKTTFTGAASIKSVAGTDIMIGRALMGNDSDNSVVDWPAVAADTFDTIDLLGTANSTGGMAGQLIEIEGLAASLWHVMIRGDAGGTEATPFANTVT